MKVCMVSKHFFPFQGGLESRVLDIARWLKEHGDDVLVLTSQERGTQQKEDISGIEVRRSSVWADIFNALITPGIFADLLRQEYDVIDVNLPDPSNSLSALIASIIRRKPLIVTYHADIIKEGIFTLPLKLLFAPIQWLLLRRAEKILVTSPHYAAQSETLAPFQGKVAVASSFIDPERFNEAVVPLPSTRDKMLLFVGRLVPYKGLPVLLEAFKMLKDTEASLIIVGDGLQRENLIAKAKDLGIEDRVSFDTGVTDDQLPSYFRSADIFVLPSVTRAEAFGLVLVEAMACGTPVISTDFSGMPYVIGDEERKEAVPSIVEGEGGLLVPPSDASALAAAIDLMLKDEGLMESLGRRGAQRVSRLFTKDVVCENIKKAYMSAITKE